MNDSTGRRAGSKCKRECEEVAEMSDYINRMLKRIFNYSISFLKNSDGKERVLRQSTMKDIMHISILKQEKAGLLFVRKVSSTKTRVIP